FIVRLYDDRVGTNQRRPTPAEFAARFIPVINSLRLYAVKFEVHNEPNHQDLYEGWGPTLTDAKEFKLWFLDVYQRIKTAVPWAQLGFPGLALHHGGWRGDLPWVQACAEAVRKADWLGCHCYWQFGNHLNFDWGLYFTEYHKLFPDKKIEITEFGDSSPNLDRAVTAKQYAEYYQALQPFGVYVRSASAFIATSPDPMWRQFAWADLDTKQPFPVVGAVAAINRTQVVEEAFVDKLAGVKDWRGLLPTRDRALPYDRRDVKGITYVVIHHTAGPSNWSANAGGGGHGLAGWDVTQTERDPYPEITYHFVVNADGTIERCHSLDVLAWHAGAKGLP
ncbi:MAG: peptidoglycan recognition family protein, partial [Chloroflexota bacterium]|nr:peptidoglycan recognition family protein [Chloroflexota bacterium]